MKFNRSKKQNNITNTQANTVDVSSLVEFVSLIASLVLLLAEAYQRAPFISARIKPLLWLLGTHWGGLEMGRGWELQNIGKAEEVKIEGSKWGGNGAFVHLKENGKGKRLILGWGHSFCNVWNKCVCLCVHTVLFMTHTERERDGRKRAIFQSGRSYFIYVLTKLICICFKPSLLLWFLADAH